MIHVRRHQLHKRWRGRLGIAADGNMQFVCGDEIVFRIRNSHHHWWPITVTFSAVAGCGAFWILKIIRTVERKQHHHNQDWETLSRPAQSGCFRRSGAAQCRSSPGRWRYRSITCSSKLHTVTKIAPVMISTKIERRKISCAGTDWGEKILVDEVKSFSNQPRAGAGEYCQNSAMEG